MKRLYIIAAIMLCAVAAQAAQLYYQFPDAARLNDTDRVLVYQNSSGSRNLTGAMLKTAQTAAKLATPRTINGVAFDGTAAITINAVDSTAREPAIPTGSALQYIRGNKTFGDFLSDVRAFAPPETAATIKTALGITTLSGSNTGDNAENRLYSGIVPNATHTGDATGSMALTVVKINGVALSGLATGLLKNATTTGVPSIAVAGTDYLAPSKFSTYSANRQAEISSKLTVYPPPIQNDLPKQFNIYMQAGGDYALYLKNVDSTGATVNITGYQFAAQYRNAPLGTLFATYSTTITDGPAGRFQMTLSSAQTTALVGTTGVWDLLQVDTVGKRTYLLNGVVTVSPVVTP
jgi:hypothetical protein